MIRRVGEFLARPVRWFLTPPECPVCYWGRLASMGGRGGVVARLVVVGVPGACRGVCGVGVDHGTGRGMMRLAPS